MPSSLMMICCGKKDGSQMGRPCPRAGGVRPALESGCSCACFRMKSVKAPGPVRSSVSKFLFPENFRSTLRAMWSHMSLRAGCPGAAAKVHCSTYSSSMHDC